MAQEQHLTFDYEVARRAAFDAGLQWFPDWVPGVDRDFTALGLKQFQVDGLMRMYARYMAHAADPGVYTLRQRVALACHFLVGRRR